MLPPLSHLPPKNTLYPCMYLSYWREGTRMQAASFNSPGPETANPFRSWLGSGYVWPADDCVLHFLLFVKGCIFIDLGRDWMLCVIRTKKRDPSDSPPSFSVVLRNSAHSQTSLPNVSKQKSWTQLPPSSPEGAEAHPLELGVWEGLSHDTQPLSPHPSWKDLVYFVYFPFIEKLLYNAIFLRGNEASFREGSPLLHIHLLIRSWVSLIFVDWMLNMIWIEPEQQVAWETLYLSV